MEFKEDPSNTRQQIIEAAEILFAEKGFRAMTLRDVTKDAEVNLAAVNYHFGSKRNLVRAVVRARVEPVNLERIKQLNKAIEKHAPNPVPLRDIFEALFRPIFTSASNKRRPDPVLIKLIARAITEPADFIKDLHSEFFEELILTFLHEIQRTLPQLPKETLNYRLFFAISTMIGTLVEQVQINKLPSTQNHEPDYSILADQLVAYVIAGFNHDSDS